MTSACGVVTKVLEAGGNRHYRVSRGMRSALNWQEPCVVIFRPKEDNSSFEAIEEAEFRLVRNGRHTYLYRPEEGEDYVNTLRHLSQAGLLVLLVLDQVKDKKGWEDDSYKTWESLRGEGGSKAADISQKLFRLTNANMTMEANNWVI